MIIAHHFFNWVTYEDRKNIRDLPQEAVKYLLKKYRAEAKNS